jgi:hypothetical protein
MVADAARRADHDMRATFQRTALGADIHAAHAAGNHGTCGRFDAGLGVRVDDRIDYTTSGTCPPGYVVAPSHAGYHYLAEPLASYGYVVVSINANRGVNAAPGVSGDAGLNLRRGRLVLRHLHQLAQWNNGIAWPPRRSASV